MELTDQISIQDSGEKQANRMESPPGWANQPEVMESLMIALEDPSLSREERLKILNLESAARREHALLCQTLFEHAADAVFIWNSDGRILEANQAVCERLEYTRRELLQKHITDLADTDAFRRILARANGSTPGLRHEVRLSTKTGRLLPAEFVLCPITFRGLPAVLGAAQDISERKQSEHVLRESRHTYQGIIDSLHETVLVIDDAAQMIVDCNRAAADLLRCGRESILGAPVSSLHLDEEHCRDFIKSQADAFAAKGFLSEFPFEFRRHDGSRFFGECSAYPLDNASGHRTGLVCVIRDLTERMRLQLQNTQKEKLTAIGQLAAGIAHEINTPIQYIGDNCRFLKDIWQELEEAISAFADLVDSLDQGRAPAAVLPAARTVKNKLDLPYLKQEVPGAVRQSLEGVDRVASIVRAMKEFAHPGCTEKTAANLNQVIENINAIARNEWKYTADLKLDLEPEPPSVVCFAGEIGQVVLNLIINASHAVADVQKTNPGVKGLITISTRHDSEWAEILIADTGGGIPYSAQAKIFEPFFTTKEVGKGTGQGLYIARNIIEAKHQGTITFETTVGKGTTFLIRLPLRPPASPE